MTWSLLAVNFEPRDSFQRPSWCLYEAFCFLCFTFKTTPRTFFLPNSSVFGRFDGLNFQTEKPFQNVSATRASPVAAALGKNAESFNLIDTCSKQAATGYSLELLNCIAEETVAPFAVPRMGSKVALRHQNAGPKMGPFSEPSRNVPILRGTKNGSEFRANF